MSLSNKSFCPSVAFPTLIRTLLPEYDKGNKNPQYRYNFFSVGKIILIHRNYCKAASADIKGHSSNIDIN